MRAKGCMVDDVRPSTRNCLEVGGELTVSEQQTTKAILRRTADQTTLPQPLVIEAADRDGQVIYLGGIIHENADLSRDFDRRIRLMRACLKRFGPGLYDTS